MTIPNCNKIYPRTNDMQTVYLKNVIQNPNIEIGDFTVYHDFVRDPRDFQKNNVLYHYPESRQTHNRKILFDRMRSEIYNE